MLLMFYTKHLVCGTWKINIIRSLEQSSLVNVYLWSNNKKKIIQLFLASMEHLSITTTANITLPARCYSYDPLVYYVVFPQQWTLAHKRMLQLWQHVIKSQTINIVICVLILQDQSGCLRCHRQLLIADRAAA